MTNKVVKVTLRKLEENGVSPKRLQEMVKVANEPDNMQKVSEELFKEQELSRVLCKVQKECDNLAEETGRLAGRIKALTFHNNLLVQENEELLRVSDIFMDTTYEVLTKLVNINLHSKEELKELQEIASRHINVIELVRAFSR